jgi:hypothetical protein
LKGNSSSIENQYQNNRLADSLWQELSEEGYIDVYACIVVRLKGDCGRDDSSPFRQPLVIGPRED